jgi:hypothetical protein
MGEFGVVFIPELVVGVVPVEVLLRRRQLQAIATRSTGEEAR